MQFQITELSKQGGRQNNQDCYKHYINSDYGLFLVADGLGGHEFGEIAANEICESIIQTFINQGVYGKDINEQSIFNIVKLATSLMQEKISEEYGIIDTQTTLALAVVTKNNLFTCHVGDSRVYRIGASNVWRTNDHSYTQKIFDKGEVKETDIMEHQGQHILYNTINMFELPDAEISIQEPISESETLLLCTDGFWQELDHNDFKDIFNSSDIDNVITNKVNDIIANNPDSDNVTVQAVKTMY